MKISGRSQSPEENISVCVWRDSGEESGEMIYVDQVKSDYEGRFGLSTKIEDQREIKISLNGEMGKVPVKNFAQKTGKTIYVSNERHDDADGSVQKPFYNLPDAIAAAGDDGKIRIIGKIFVDENIGYDLNGVNIEGGTIVLRGSEWRGNVKFSSAELVISSDLKFFGITKFGIGTKIDDGKKITADYIYTDVDIKNDIAAKAVIINEDAKVNKEKIEAEYVIFCGSGGRIEIRGEELIPMPQNGRACSIDKGMFKAEECALPKGTHYVTFDYDFLLCGVDVLKRDDGNYNMKVSGIAKDLLKKHNQLRLVVGLYEDNKLVAAKSQKIKTGGNVNEEFSFDNMPADRFDIKIFLWDSFSRIVPLTSVFIADNNTKIQKDSDVFYVSADGTENAAGTFSDPLSLNAAISMAKGKKSPQKIILRGGEYKFTSSISFNAENENLVIMPYDGEKVLFTDSDKISYDLFKPADEAVKSRIIDENARDKILMVNIKEAGIKNLGLIRGYELQNSSGRFSPTLTVDGKHGTLARYPNKTAEGRGTFFTIQAGIDEKPLNPGSKTEKFSFFVDDEAQEHISKWAPNYDLWLCGYLRHLWADGIYKGTIKKTASGACYFESNNPWKYSEPKEGGRVYFQNVLEELDSPGEGYLERPSGKLHLYPPESFGKNSDIRFSSNNKYALQFDGSKNITLKDIKLNNVAVKISNAKNIMIDGCNISGSAGIDIDNSVKCVVKNNYMHDLLGGGISILSGGDPENLTYSGNCIENNIITDFAQETKCYVPAINLHGVGSLVTNNEIYNAPHAAILIGGQMNTIELNKIHDVCLETADSGAIYGHGNFESAGNIIRYNLFENIDRKGSQDTSVYTNNAIYLDMLLSNTDVYGNIFSKCESAALFNGGRSNMFRNNIVADCEKSLTISNMGQWDNYPQEVAKMVDRFEKNNPYYKNDIWKEKFPSLYNLREDDPTVPKYCSVSDNVIYNAPFPGVAQIAQRYGSVRNNRIVADSEVFSDYTNGVLSVKNDGTVFDEIPDFEQIPYYLIGLKNSIDMN